MTITKYDSFALKPTRCWKCNKLFIFEWYNWSEFSIPGCGAVKRNYCKKCINQKEK